MEADYGSNSFVFDVTDEYDDPDYSNYEQWHIHGEEEDDEEDEEAVVEPPAALIDLTAKTKRSNFQKQSNNQTVQQQQQTIVSKRKSKRKRTSSVEEFYRSLLEWNLKNTSSFAGRTFGQHFPTFFTNKTQYFDALKDVVMEESRASIAQSLVGSAEGKLELRLINVDDEGEMMLLEFAIVSGGLDMTRPGWVFKLFPTAHGSVMSSTGGGSSGGYRGAFGHHPHHHKHSSNHQHNKHSSNHMDLETLAVVAQGGKAMSVIHSNDAHLHSHSYRNVKLPLWIHSSSPLATVLRQQDNNHSYCSSSSSSSSSSSKNHHKTTSDSNGHYHYRFIALAVNSMLSYQRMITACDVYPSPPFMHRLLGGRPATHIKFDCSEGEEDVGGDEGKNKNVEESSSLTTSSSSSSSTALSRSREHSLTQLSALLQLPSSPPIPPLLSSHTNTVHRSVSSSVYHRQLVPLNDSQLKAIHLICNECGIGVGGGSGGYQGGGLHLIQGPPGTGKTHFLVALLATLLCLAQGPGQAQERGGQGQGEGQEHTKTKAVSDEKIRNTQPSVAAETKSSSSSIRLMVCAPSNKAVSMALEKFLLAAGDTALHGLVRVALVGVEEKMDECSATTTTTSSSSSSNNNSNSQDHSARSSINSSNSNNPNKSHRKRTRDEPNAPGQELATAQEQGLTQYPNQHADDDMLSNLSLPSFLTNPLGRLLRPQSSADVFVYTYSERIREVVLMSRQYLKDEILVALAQGPGLGTAPGQGLGSGPARKKGPGQTVTQGPGLGQGLATGQGSFIMPPLPSLSSLLGCVGELLQQLQMVMNIIEMDARAWYHQQVKRLWREVVLKLRNVSKGQRLAPGPQSMSTSDEDEDDDDDGDDDSNDPDHLAALIESIIHHLSLIAETFHTPAAAESLAEGRLKHASVVFCTLASAGSSIVRRIIDHVDVLVVDEAAQAIEAELVIPLALGWGVGTYHNTFAQEQGLGIAPGPGLAPTQGVRNLILVGDPKQLPATIISTENLRTGRGRLLLSAMQRLMEFCSHPSHLLDTQYRMHPAISSLPNELFYHGMLKNADSVTDPDRIPWALRPPPPPLLPLLPPTKLLPHQLTKTTATAKRKVKTKAVSVADVAVATGPDSHHGVILGGGLSARPLTNGVGRDGGNGVDGEGKEVWPLWMQQYAFIDVPSTTSFSTSSSLENHSSSDNDGREMRGSGISKMHRPSLSSSLSQSLSTKGGSTTGGGTSSGGHGHNKSSSSRGGGGGGGGYSFSNIAEAKVVCHMVSILQRRYASCGQTLRSHVCIIAMYSGQVSCIQHMLQTQGLAQGPGLAGGGGYDGPMVHTVDSFQGSEADVVILSFVRNNTHKDIGFLRGFQRLNVALTRAKHLLLAVGCVDTLMGPDPTETKCNNNHSSATHDTPAITDTTTTFTHIHPFNHASTKPTATNSDIPIDHHDKLSFDQRHYYLRKMILDARERGRLFSAADVLHSNFG